MEALHPLAKELLSRETIVKEAYNRANLELKCSDLRCELRQIASNHAAAISLLEKSFRGAEILEGKAKKRAHVLAQTVDSLAAALFEKTSLLRGLYKLERELVRIYRHFLRTKEISASLRDRVGEILLPQQLVHLSLLEELLSLDALPMALSLQNLRLRSAGSCGPNAFGLYLLLRKPIHCI